MVRTLTFKHFKHCRSVIASFNTEPLHARLQEVQPLSIEMVSRTEREPLWDLLVREFHYLGCQKLLGHRLKYLVLSRGRPVAALSFSAPALKLRVRDCFIGWSEDQRKKHLGQLANNSRFLILPWVSVPHLASHVLGLTIKELKKDWRRLFNTDLLLLETFVDPGYFKATSYKAANWRFLGTSFGSTKQGTGYIYHGVPKEVYVYVLNKNLRHIIGCTQKPCDLFQRPPQPHSLQKVEDLHMLLQHSQWHPELVSRMNLTETDLCTMADELISFHQKFHRFYGRIEHKRLGMAYLSGLLSNAQAKSVEPLALEFLDKHAVRSLQRFMKECLWDHTGMQKAHQHMLSEKIRDPAGMINVDSSEFAKKGTESVGVARQYCGQLGKVDNCQSGVFVGYASPKGYGLLTCRLYMPEIWFSKEYEQRRKDNLVPPDMSFQTKPHIALDLIHEIVKTNLFPAQWIGCDATFGQDPNFLKQLPAHLYYFAAIGSDTRVFLKKPKTGLPAYAGKGPRPKKIRILPGEPAPQSVAALAGSKRLRWQPVILAEGAKGPIVAEVVCKRVYLSRGGLPEDTPVWLFIRKTQDGQTKYAISNAPADMAFSELCRVSTMRWPIEQCFKEGKDQLGMDKYEHRSWPAWHRHMLYVFLAQHFLLRVRLRFKKNSLSDSASSAYAPGSHVAAALC